MKRILAIFCLAAVAVFPCRQTHAGASALAVDDLTHKLLGITPDQFSQANQPQYLWDDGGATFSGFSRRAIDLKSRELLTWDDGGVSSISWCTSDGVLIWGDSFQFVSDGLSATGSGFADFRRPLIVESDVSAHTFTLSKDVPTLPSSVGNRGQICQTSSGLFYSSGSAWINLSAPTTGGSGTVTSVGGDSGTTTGLTVSVANPTTTPALALGGVLTIPHGGTGATTAAGALSNLGGASASALTAETSRATTAETAITDSTASAPLQPFSAYLQYGNRLSRVSGGYGGITLVLSNIGLTYASPDEIVAWLTQAVYFIQPNLGSSPLAIDLSNNALTNSGDIIDAIAAALTQPPFTDFGGGITICLQGGTNAPVTPNVAHQDATLVLQLPAPVPANAGIVLSFGTGNGAVSIIIYDATIPFSGSSDNGNTTTVGVQDSPTMAAVTGYINSQPSFPDSVNYFYADGTGGNTLSAEGTYSATDPFEGDYPVILSGPAVLDNNPGVVGSSNASTTAIESYNGSNVQTN